jgi:hypothetical protein
MSILAPLFRLLDVMSQYIVLKLNSTIRPHDVVDHGAIARLEELGQLKNLMTSSGIESVTF